jgi:hypothetical protein
MGEDGRDSAGLECDGGGKEMDGRGWVVERKRSNLNKMEGGSIWRWCAFG